MTKTETIHDRILKLLIENKQLTRSELLILTQPETVSQLDSALQDLKRRSKIKGTQRNRKAPIIWSANMPESHSGIAAMSIH